MKRSERSTNVYAVKKCWSGFTIWGKLTFSWREESQTHQTESVHMFVDKNPFALLSVIYNFHIIKYIKGSERHRATIESDLDNWKVCAQNRLSFPLKQIFFSTRFKLNLNSHFLHIVPQGSICYEDITSMRRLITVYYIFVP